MKGLCEAYLLVLTALSSAVAVKAEPKTVDGSSSSTPNHHKEVRYEYRYAIDDPQSGVVSTQWEHRLGEYVKGAYSLVEPDGKVRHVDYEVDGPRGFHAVIRTTPPVNSLLSFRQQDKFRQNAKQPLVNVLTNRALGTDRQRSGRLLPINFHSVKPDYYLAFAKGEPANYQDSQPDLEAPDVAPAPTASSVRIQDSPTAEGNHDDVHDAHDSHHHDKSHEEYVLPSVEGVTFPRQNKGTVATGSSVSNIRTYYAALPRGDVNIPSIPSTRILPPAPEVAAHPLQTQVLFTPYTGDYFGG